MPLPEGYAVIRFKKQGREIYEVMDYQQGQMLSQVVKSKRYMEKEELLKLIRRLTAEVQKLSQKGSPKFPITPYNVLVTGEGEALFLDLTESSNRKVLKKIQSNPKCRPFQTGGTGEKEEMYYFSYGKTLQYLFAHITCTPKLTRKEEHCILSIIRRCLKFPAGSGRFHFDKILKRLPQDIPKKKKKRTMILLLTISIVVGLFGICFFRKSFSRSEKEAAVKDNIPKAKKDTKAYEVLGMDYFLKQDYSNSRKYFTEAPKSKKALCFRKLSEYMLGMKTDDAIQSLVKEAESIQDEEEAEGVDLSLFRVQRTIPGETADEETIRMGDKIIKDLEIHDKAAGDSAKAEVYEGLAEVYERYKDIAKAIEAYEKLLEVTPQKAALEAVYRKLPVLYSENGEVQKAAVIAEQAIKEFPFSELLRVQYLRYQCAGELSNEECAKLILQAVQEIPELPQSLSFQQMQREYNIKIEGETIWIEK